MQSLGSGFSEKMRTSLDENNQVQYVWQLNDQAINMNGLLGQNISLEYKADISCVACGRKTNKSFSQGYCYPCFKKLAQCDTCIMSPEKCHYHLGTCREPEWGDKHCMIDHYVYLANSSGIKVGITRNNQLPTRWLDQGAVQALPILRVKTRRLSGLCETAFKAHVADKTSWQRMLKNQVEPMDLLQQRDALMELVADDLVAIRKEFGDDAIEVLDEMPLEIQYPVLEYPVKVKSFNLDKTAVISGKLMGIKGQYLILDTGVINIRKYGGYSLELLSEKAA